MSRAVFLMVWCWTVPVLVAGGVAAGLYFKSTYWPAIQSSNWPMTKGRITASRLQPYGSEFKPVVEYEYTVGATTYTSDRIRLDQAMTGVRAAAESVVARYPLGSEVLVHYHLESPDQAVLEPGATLFVPVLIALVVFKLVAVGVLPPVAAAFLESTRRSLAA